MEALIKALKTFGNTLPTILGVILLVGLIKVALPSSIFTHMFSFNPFIDSLIGSALGSVLAGNPVTSYILGGEMLKQGVSLIAVTSFIVAWVTVGIVQLPAEAILLGKKFAIIRNATAFLFSILVAIITVFLVNAI